MIQKLHEWLWLLNDQTFDYLPNTSQREFKVCVPQSTMMFWLSHYSMQLMLMSRQSFFDVFKEQDSKDFMLFKYDGLSKTQVYRANAVMNSKKINQHDPAQIKLYSQMRQLSWFVSRPQWSLCFPHILNDIGYTIFVPRSIHLLQLSCNFHKYLVIFICQAKLKWLSIWSIF